MRVGPQSFIARPAWHDRNPKTYRYRQTSQDAGPHTLSLWWEYTVPAGKKAMVELLACKVQRTVAATTPGKAHAMIYIQGDVGGEGAIIDAISGINVVGDREVMTSGQSMLLNSGHTIKGYTTDSSTGGACDYLVAVKLTEFDA